MIYSLSGSCHQPLAASRAAAQRLSEPKTPNLKPQTPNPKPQTPNSKPVEAWRAAAQRLCAAARDHRLAMTPPEILKSQCPCAFTVKSQYGD
jgi:hypothetical protein